MLEIDAILALFCPKNMALQDTCNCVDPKDRCPFYKGTIFDDEGHIIQIKCKFDEVAIHSGDDIETPLQKVMGKWPGNESMETILGALKDMDGKGSES